MSSDQSIFAPSRSHLYGNSVFNNFPYSRPHGGYLNNLYYNNSFYPENFGNEWTWSDAIEASRYIQALAPYYMYPFGNTYRAINYYVPGTNTQVDYTTATGIGGASVNTVQISTDSTVTVADWLARPKTAVHYGSDKAARPILLFCANGSRPKAVAVSAGTQSNPILIIDNVGYQC